jgi:hypothetical protein
VTAGAAVLAALALPAAASANTPATLYQATLDGSTTFTEVYSGAGGDSWTTAATIGLNGTTPVTGATAATGDVWIPNGAVGSTPSTLATNPNSRTHPLAYFAV